jgi:RHS repeat-associated protein
MVTVLEETSPGNGDYQEVEETEECDWSNIDYNMELIECDDPEMPEIPDPPVCELNPNDTECQAPECQDGYSVEEGVNPLSPASGNVHRKIEEIANNRLNWIRYNNSLRSSSDHLAFGTAAGWRHSFQWDLRKVVDEKTKKEGYVVITPEGASIKLSNDPKSSNHYQVVQDKVEVALAGKIKVLFGLSQRQAAAGLVGSYRAEKLMAPIGDVILTYDEQNRLAEVKGPYGEWFKLSWKQLARKEGLIKQIPVKNSPAQAEYLDVVVPDAFTKARTDWVQIHRLPNGGLAEVQLIESGTGRVVSARGSDMKAVSRTLFDGNADTVCAESTSSAKPLTVGFALSGPAVISKVRLLFKPGFEEYAKTMELRLRQPDRGERMASVLTKVESSNNTSVEYEYATIEGQDSVSDLALVEAEYSDGAKAKYKYLPGSSKTAYRTFLSEAVDPRYKGPAKQIEYTYHEIELGQPLAGAVRTEGDPRTGRPWVTLELDSRNPKRRTLHYSDQRIITYELDGEDEKAKVVSRTDSLGRSKSKKIERVVREGGSQKTAFGASKNEIPEFRVPKGRMVMVRAGQSDEFIARDHKGKTTLIRKDKNGRVIQVLSSEGKILKDIVYDEKGRNIGFSTAKGVRYERTLDSRGLPLRQRSSRGSDLSFKHDALGRVSEVTDNKTNKIVRRVEYDKRGYVSSRTSASGKTVRYERNERGQATKYISPSGKVWTYEYDEFYRRTKSTNYLGQVALTEYDILGRKTRETGYDGKSTRYEYNELPMSCGSCTLSQRPTRIVEDDGTVSTFLYDTEGRLLAHTVAHGTDVQATTTYTYNDDNKVTTVTDPLGRVTRYTYDDEGNRLSMTDPAGLTTLWAYDEDDNLVSETAPSGAVTRHRYDEFKRRIATTDALGNTTHFKYDAHDNLIEQMDAAGKRTVYTYSPSGARTSATCGDSKETWSYNAAGKLSVHVSCSGLTTRYSYDEFGHLVSTSDSLGRTFTYAYNPDGKRTQVTDPLGRTVRTGYDALGRVQSMTAPDGSFRTQTHDARGRLLSSTDAAGQTTRYTYTVAGMLESLTDANGQTYRFTYDALRRKTSMVYPDGSAERWTYNLAGQLLTYVNRSGQTRVSAYDAAGRLVSESWRAAALAGANAPVLPSSVSYTYDTAGRLSSMTDAASSLTFTYDRAGRLVSETSDLADTLAPGLAAHTVGYGYDTLGRRDQLTYPDQTRVRYVYDVHGRLSSIDDRGKGGPVLAAYRYDVAGRLQSLQRENGVESRYTYDLAGQVTKIEHGRGQQILASAAYTLDVLGRRTSQTREDQIAETYRYDATSQLTDVNYGSASPIASGPSPLLSEAFAYDPVGNRTQVGRVVPNAPMANETYQANNLNQYTRIDVSPSLGQVISPIYDKNGNLLHDGRQLYRYDAKNRLIAVESGLMKAEFFYDPRNRCILRRFYTLGVGNVWLVDAEQSRVLIYDSAWNLLIEQTLNGKLAGRYIHGYRTDEILRADLLNSKASKLDPTYALTDGLCSTVALSNKEGKVQQRYRYSACGQPKMLKSDYSLPTSGSSLLNYRFLFTGREWLVSAQLSDHRYRYYHAILGRWTSTDPIGFYGKDENLYRYVHNNVLNSTDSTGLSDGFGHAGKCCNNSQGEEWALVSRDNSQGVWEKLLPGQCVGSTFGSEDCEGMTCGGGFYKVYPIIGGDCSTPGCDSWPYASLRWVPGSTTGESPTSRQSGQGDTPPGYVYGPPPCCNE